MEINAKRRQIDMLNGPLWSRLPMFALPVAATAILEQLFNASDIAVVGNFTGAERTAALTAVDQRPLPVLPHPDRHRLHYAAAAAGAVSRLDIHMKAVQTVGTVVAVVSPGVLRRYQPPAEFAGKAVPAGMSFVISFFKGLPFIFTVH